MKLNEIERNEVKLTSEIRQFSSPLNRPLSTALSEPQADFLAIFFLTLERSRCALDIFLLSPIVGTYEATDLSCLHPSREGSLGKCSDGKTGFTAQVVGPLTEPTPALGTHRSIGKESRTEYLQTGRRSLSYKPCNHSLLAFQFPAPNILGHNLSPKFQTPPILPCF